MKNVDRPGIDYVGARCTEFTRDDLIMEVAIVNELGIARDFDVLGANFSISAACRDGFATHIENGRWIPAPLDGKYVESVWANPRLNATSQFKRTQ
jgi:hypothetical protein